MKRLLLVAATLPEVSGLLDRLRPSQPAGRKGLRWEQGASCLDLCITGVGMVNTAFALGQYLARHRPAKALHLGIGGGFDRRRPLGAVLEIVADCFPELGAESPGGFLDMQALGFPVLERPGGKDYGWLENPAPEGHWPSVRGITVNTVSGTAEGAARRSAWGAEVETMESAAFFHAMRAEDIPFASLRSLSNYVEARNRDAWQIPAALASLAAAALPWLARELPAEDFGQILAQQD